MRSSGSLFGIVCTRKRAIVRFLPFCDWISFFGLRRRAGVLRRVNFGVLVAVAVNCKEAGVGCLLDIGI